MKKGRTGGLFGRNARRLRPTVYQHWEIRHGLRVLVMSIHAEHGRQVAAGCSVAGEGRESLLMNLAVCWAQAGYPPVRVADLEVQSFPSTI